jgi:hypothetical protein
MTKRSQSVMDSVWRILFCVALLPWCLGATWALAVVIRSAGSTSLFWVSVLGGAAAWLAVFLLLPKPLWIYVVGHELTHALWAWLCGGRVKSFRATARGGEVVVTKSNPLIVLAPYFFPLYAVLWAVFWAVASWLGDWNAYRPWFHFGLGFTYAFHVTLTAHILRVRQPDLDVEGWLVSSVVIWLGNVLVLLVALPGLTGQVSLWTALRWWVERTGRFLLWLTSAF